LPDLQSITKNNTEQAFIALAANRNEVILGLIFLSLQGTTLFSVCFSWPICFQRPSTLMKFLLLSYS